jgi:hypothetical protein
MSILDKIKVIWNTIINSNELKYIIPFLGVVLLVVILSFFFNKAKYHKVYLLVYVFIITALMIIYFNPIIKLLNHFMDTIVNGLLFPNLALYIGIILVVNILLIVTVFNDNLSKFIKGINLSLFALMQLLMVFIIKNIVVNNIDITKRLTADTNIQLLVLVEASIFVFALWLLFLLVIKLFNHLQENKNETVEIKNVIYESSYKVKAFNKKYRFNNLMLDNNEESNYDSLIEYVPIKKVQ